MAVQSKLEELRRDVAICEHRLQLARQSLEDAKQDLALHLGDAADGSDRLHVCHFEGVKSCGVPIEKREWVEARLADGVLRIQVSEGRLEISSNSPVNARLAVLPSVANGVAVVLVHGA